MALSTIDHFEIVRELGRGGMGRVYLARDTRLERQVAIKVVNLEPAETETERKERAAVTERLLREARIAATLDHPGIVTIYQVGISEVAGDQVPYIAMQFIDGPTLEALLGLNVPLDAGETKRILREVAAALDHAHERGVTHRDIKPSNIMVARNRAAKVCDFGIAKSATASRTQSSLLLGTPYYMSPEQLKYQTVDGRSDQWALAVVAYRMVTGQLPFQGDDLHGLASKILMGPVSPPRDFDSTLSPAVTAVMEKALSKDAAGRYPTCAEFADELIAALDASSEWRSSVPVIAFPSPLTSAVAVSACPLCGAERAERTLCTLCGGIVQRGISFAAPLSDQTTFVPQAPARAPALAPTSPQMAPAASTPPPTTGSRSKMRVPVVVAIAGLLLVGAYFLLRPAGYGQPPSPSGSPKVTATESGKGAGADTPATTPKTSVPAAAPVPVAPAPGQNAAEVDPPKRGGGASPTPQAPAPPPKTEPALVPPASQPGFGGRWQADVKYSWGLDLTETFDFKVDGNEVDGTASYGRTPRGIVDGKIEGNKITFTTKTNTMLGDKTYQDIHHYKGRLAGDSIEFILQHETEWDSKPPDTFTAKRVDSPKQ
ncbi:MAG TPA: serine/threonine-protein kinase [Bryobacteraceae bacterium]|nr:serine/threonine-protein kinase [Bryobacteraceae bacterium]